ncbi:hypothetical protein HZ326_8285 [Fusarium oxysporum f. sp. albedinis]|nr:hypothetical protein HZ326_8285 [Fusarium oxysporum f. sp. albedinis]
MMIEGETLRECLKKASLSIPLEARKTCRAFQFEFEKKSAFKRQELTWLQSVLLCSYQTQWTRDKLDSSSTHVTPFKKKYLSTAHSL